MSLTSHLDDKTSLVREYIYGCAPQLVLAGSRGNIGKEFASSFGFDDVLSRDLAVPIPEAATDRRSHASVAGAAFDYRTRMAIGALEPAMTVAASGVDRLADYVDRIENGQHRLRVLGEGFDLAAQLVDERSSEVDLGRAAVLFAWCDSVYRVFPQVLMGSLGEKLDAASSGTDLVAGIPDLLLTDIEALLLASTPQVQEWKRQIVEGEVFTPNPKFAGSALVGGADADWIVGSTLIDCKTAEKLNAPWLRESLFQLLGYALLDLEDRFNIRNVAVWLPRHATLKSWSINSLIGADAETILPALRKGFLAAL